MDSVPEHRAEALLRILDGRVYDTHYSVCVCACVCVDKNHKPATTLKCDTLSVCTCGWGAGVYTGVH